MMACARQQIPLAQEFTFGLWMATLGQFGENQNFLRELFLTCYAPPELSARWGARGSLVGRRESGGVNLRRVGLGHAGSVSRSSNGSD